MPYLALAFTVAGLVSLGLPGFSGFVAELLVFLGAFRVYPLLAAMAVTGMLFTAIYVLRVVQKIFFGPENAFASLRTPIPLKKPAWRF